MPARIFALDACWDTNKDKEKEMERKLSEFSEGWISAEDLLPELRSLVKVKARANEESSDCLRSPKAFNNWCREYPPIPCMFDRV